MDTFTNTLLCILLFSGGLQLLLMMQHNDFDFVLQTLWQQFHFCFKWA